jgi:hypothetical protein
MIDAEMLKLVIVNMPNFLGLLLLSIALWRILHVLIALLKQSLSNQSRLEDLLRKCLDKEQKRN